jgi:ketol-acid reductoisomerase
MSEKTLFKNQDGDLSVLDDRTVAVIGYGNQGRAQALNMRDSGVENIIIGNRGDSSKEQAKKDGFEAYSMDQAANKADILFFLVPDEVQPQVYKEKIEPYLKEGDVLNFASGYNITYNLITPPENIDVIMIAPRMIGTMVRELYEVGDGAPSFLAINQNYSGKAKDIGLALGKAIGSTRSGIIEIDSFALETKSDLLMEQGLIPIILNAMIAKYELEIAEGMPPAGALLELYLSRELGYIFEKMAEQGIIGQMPLHSQTSQYGQISRIDELQEGEAEEVSYNDIKKFMGRQLRNIGNGKFEREWSNEQQMGYPVFHRLFEKYNNSEMIKEEQKTIKELGLSNDLT